LSTPNPLQRRSISEKPGDDFYIWHRAPLRFQLCLVLRRRSTIRRAP
jgi:hypothetical protein